MPGIRQRPIKFDVILPELKVMSRKQVFQALAKAAAEKTGISKQVLLERLMMKERQASSGIGDGVAIPHLCLADVPDRFILFARLAHEIDFEAVDDQPVDLVCLLLSPEKDGPYHLRRLALLSRLLRDESFCQRLRSAENSDAIRALISGTQSHTLAA